FLQHTPSRSHANLATAGEKGLRCGPSASPLTVLETGPRPFSTAQASLTIKDEIEDLWPLESEGGRLVESLVVAAGPCYYAGRLFKKKDDGTVTRATSKTDNGSRARSGAEVKSTRPRRKKQAPQLREKTKKLILKAFQRTYEAHHGENG